MRSAPTNNASSGATSLGEAFRRRNSGGKGPSVTEGILSETLDGLGPLIVRMTAHGPSRPPGLVRFGLCVRMETHAAFAASGASPERVVRRGRKKGNFDEGFGLLFTVFHGWRDCRDAFQCGHDVCQGPVSTRGAKGAEGIGGHARADLLRRGGNGRIRLSRAGIEADLTPCRRGGEVTAAAELETFDGRRQNGSRTRSGKLHDDSYIDNSIPLQ